MAAVGLCTERRTAAAEVEVEEVEAAEVGSKQAAGYGHRELAHIESVDKMLLRSVPASPGAVACLSVLEYMRLVMMPFVVRGVEDRRPGAAGHYNFHVGHRREGIRSHTLAGPGMTCFSGLTMHAALLPHVEFRGSSLGRAAGGGRYRD